jgi:restriction endonuclease S subunit
MASENFFIYDNQHSKGAKMPRGDKQAVMHYQFALPEYKEQEKIAMLLDRFDKLCNGITGGIPEEIEARIRTVETEEGVKLVQESYDWLIEIYSRILPKKANELITTANETLISDLEYQE